jgi:cytochrome c6
MAGSRAGRATAVSARARPGRARATAATAPRVRNAVRDVTRGEVSSDDNLGSFEGLPQRQSDRKAGRAAILAHRRHNPGRLRCMTGRRTSRGGVIAVLAVLVALAASACGGSGGSSSSATTSDNGVVSAAAGKAVFKSNCSSCHTLADAGATGSVGPNLDDLKPDDATVVHQVTNGGGVMPAFSGTLTNTEILSVAKYVSSAAGNS